MIQAGDTIGPYRLVRTIGRGAFGEVWLGEKRSTLLTTQVALKMPLVAETEIEAVRQEAALWLQASGHPNIVPVMDAEVYDGQVVIASEYIAGGSLHAWLEGNGGKAPSLEVAVTITNGILAGLDYLHRVGLTHRDLKPENILLQDGIPRLTDFGLARVLKTAAQTGTISGTPRYMAPETFSGTYSIASDLWAVGVLLYELLTGNHPFRTQELMALIIAIQSHEPAPLPDTIPERLRNIVTRLLAKSPVDRYVSASAVREALQNCLQPVAATPVVAADTSVLPSHNLPVQPTSFIGREKQIAELKGLLEHTCLLTLTGSGGCGKTRLSFQVAEEVLDRFAGGVWLVELAPLADPALVPQSVANVLGIREEPGAPLLQALIEALKTKNVLLILDNCEHLLSACAQFADAVLHACPQVKILASSREGLNIAGETVCRIPSLSLPESKHSLTPESLAQYEAVRLFVARATAALPAFRITPQNAMAVAQVCVRLDGIPLAIELAAARVRSLPVEQIEARLHDRFRLLTGGSRTALPRQQTLHALIQWSVDLLSDQEKALLRRLSVFAGGWSLAAAEKVCACEKIEEWEMLDLLTALVDKSLVAYEEQAGSARYRLLETVRQYALELLWESGEGDAVRMRHRDWFLQFAEDARPKLFSDEQIIYMRLLEVEHGNLRAAIEWSRSDPEGAESGLRLTAALWRFWWDSSYLVEGMQRFEAALAHEGAMTHTHARAAALIGAGIMAQIHDELVEAERYYTESLVISQELEDEHGIATAIGKRGDVARARADNEVALQLLTEALVMHRRLGNQWDIGQTLICLGHVASSQENWDKARACFEECYDVWRGLGDRRYSHALNNLSALDFRQSDLNGAQAKLEASLKVQEEAGDNWVIPRTLVRLGAVSAELGDYARSRSLLAKSVRQGMATGQRWVIIVGTEELAHLAAGDEQLERAARLYGAVDSLGEGKYPLNIGPPSHSKRAVVHDALGEKAFEAACAEGRAMTMEQAVSYALLEADS